MSGNGWFIVCVDGGVSILKWFESEVPVSSPAHKELGGNHAILTTRKLNKLRNQRPFLDPSDKLGHRTSHSP